MSRIDQMKDPELQERLKSANTPEELLAITREVGYTLGDEELDGIAGGGMWDYCSDDDCAYFKV